MGLFSGFFRILHTIVTYFFAHHCCIHFYITVVNICSQHLPNGKSEIFLAEVLVEQLQQRLLLHF
jgi:uncharacterized membrane protein required for colicin V production